MFALQKGTRRSFKTRRRNCQENNGKSYCSTEVAVTPRSTKRLRLHVGRVFAPPPNTGYGIGLIRCSLPTQTMCMPNGMHVESGGDSCTVPCPTGSWTTYTQRLRKLLKPRDPCGSVAPVTTVADTSKIHTCPAHRKNSMAPHGHLGSIFWEKVTTEACHDGNIRIHIRMRKRRC